eukprot:1159220-Pelagomonas_calceolata.AAC.11
MGGMWHAREQSWMCVGVGCSRLDTKLRMAGRNGRQGVARAVLRERLGFRFKRCHSCVLGEVLGATMTVEQSQENIGGDNDDRAITGEHWGRQ